MWYETVGGFLQAASVALLEAFFEKDWAANARPLAQALAGVGGSHRGVVEAISQLQGVCSRADVLCSHAAAECLSTLLRPKVCTAPVSYKESPSWSV